MTSHQQTGRVLWSAMTSAVPGFETPGAGYEAPFEMLSACHERVERMLALLAKLQRHLRHTGCDEAAGRAACDVMRYFDLAAPLHHQDEELHVFPILMASADPTLQSLVERLLQDHRAMEAAWPAARQVLQQVAEGQPGPSGPAALPAASAAQLAAFAGLYQAHMQAEDEQAYPAAQQALSAQAQQAMSADMMQRRGVPTQR